MKVDLENQPCFFTAYELMLDDVLTDEEAKKIQEDMQ